MITLKQFVAEAFNTWTHAEDPMSAAKLHIKDLRASGHKILGTEHKTLPKTLEPGSGTYNSVHILAQDQKGRKTYHAIMDADHSDPRVSKSAKSMRVMRGATKMHMSMKGKFHPDLT